MAKPKVIDLAAERVRRHEEADEAAFERGEALALLPVDAESLTVGRTPNQTYQFAIVDAASRMGLAITEAGAFALIEALADALSSSRRD